MLVPSGPRPSASSPIISLHFFLKFYFIFKLYIIVLVLPNIEMNPPEVLYPMFEMPASLESSLSLLPSLNTPHPDTKVMTCC